MAVLNFSCKKEKNIATTPPESMAFEFIGKDGKSLTTSLRDSVKVSYVENGITIFHALSVQKLYTFESNRLDTTKTSSKYNGLVINDGRFMSSLSSRNPNPIRNYNIYLNGTNMGILYMDYWGYQAAYPSPSSNNLMFNSTPVLNDFSGDYFSQGSPINLLQVQ